MAAHPGELGDLLAEAYAQMEEQVAAALVDGGFDDIRPVHAPAFQAAAGIEEPTVTSMAGAVGVTKQHMSQLVRELEDLGYVTRTPGGDARRKIVALTERGVEAVRCAATATASTERAWRRALGDRAANSLVIALRRLVDAPR